MRASFLITFLLISLSATLICHAMQIKDGQLKIPTPEITLIWEHYCIQHMAQKQWHLARLNKEIIDYQRANKINWNSLPNRLEHFENKLDEAKKAKAEAGELWGCNPPQSKLAFIELKVGQCFPPNPAESFISTTTNSVDIKGMVGVTDPNCTKPKIEWNIVVPKYGIKKKSSLKAVFSEQSQKLVVPSVGLSEDETAYVCREVDTDGTNKAKGKFVCGYIAYTLGKTESNVTSGASYLLTIPKAPAGNRSNDFNVDVEAKLFCDGKFADVVNAKIGQDEKDQLRQEYMDIKKRHIPERNELVAYLETRYFDLTKFNSSRRVNGNKYSYILCKILDNLDGVKRRAKTSMIINSGYRNPFKNALTKGSAKESSHIYGLAADIDLMDFDDDGKADGRDWETMAEAARNEGACVEPRENTPQWIHMDWRETCPPGW